MDDTRDQIGNQSILQNYQMDPQQKLCLKALLNRFIFHQAKLNRFNLRNLKEFVTKIPSWSAEISMAILETIPRVSIIEQTPEMTAKVLNDLIWEEQSLQLSLLSGSGQPQKKVEQKEQADSLLLSNSDGEQGQIESGQICGRLAEPKQEKKKIKLVCRKNLIRRTDKV